MLRSSDPGLVGTCAQSVGDAHLSTLFVGRFFLFCVAMNDLERS